MANRKYDNLTALMTSGGLRWVQDTISAYLMHDVVYDASDITLGDTGGMSVGRMPVAGRQVDATGALLGNPVSFNRVAKDTPHQVVLAKETGASTEPLVLAFFDVDEMGQPLVIENNGTLIVRPTLVDPEGPPTPGVWVRI